MDKKMLDKIKRQLAKCEKFEYKKDCVGAEVYGIKALGLAKKERIDNSKTISYIHYALGKVYLGLDKFNEAEAHTKKAIKIMSTGNRFDQLHALELLVEIYLKWEKYSLAENVSREILKFNEKEYSPQNQETPISIARDRLAECLIELKKFREAEELTIKSLKIHEKENKDFPKLYSPALINMANILFEKGNFEEAKKNCEKVLSLYEGKGVNLSKSFGMPCTIFNKGEMKKQLSMDLITSGFLKKIYILYKKIGDEKKTKELTKLGDKLVLLLTDSGDIDSAIDLGGF